MARRPRARVDTSRLRAMGETTAVVARPVDTYVRPAAPQKNQQYAQILSALSTVNPALDTFIDDKVTKDREKQANLGYKSFYEATPEERKAVSAQIKSGEINELQSPFWVEGFARSLLRNHATTFGSALTLEWNRKKDTGGFDFNAFVAEERGKYIEANNLSSFRSDLFNDEFAGVTQKFEAQVQQRNYEHRIAQAKKARMQTLGDSMVTVLEAAQNKMDTTPFDAQTGDSFSANINAVIQSAIDQGMDPTGVINMAAGFLEGTSTDLSKKEDEDGAKVALNMLRNLKLKSGTYGLVYKDRYEAAEATSERLILSAGEDAEKADEDALTVEKENLFEKVYDGLNKAFDDKTNPTAVQDFWEANTDNLRRIGKLDEFTEGDMLPTLNKLYKTRGKITPDVTDEEMLDLLESVDKNNTYTSQEMQTLAEDMGLSTQQYIAFQNYNRDRPNQFIKELGLLGVRKALTDGVDEKGMFDFGPQGGISLQAVEAKSKLNAFINSQLALDATKETKIANILAESQRLIEEYGNKAKNTTIQTQAQTSNSIPTASGDIVEKFNKGTHHPWKNPNGSMVLSDTAGAVEDFLKAAKKGDSLDSTEFGKLIGPLLKAGVAFDTIEDAVLSDFRSSLGLQDDQAIQELEATKPDLSAFSRGNAPEQSSTKSTREPVSAVEFAQELVQKGGELVSGALGGEPAENKPMFEASGGQFFNDGKGSLTEQAVGAVVEGVSELISGETDTAVAADAALAKAQQYLSPEAKARIASGENAESAEVTQGSGTISAEDPLFKPDNILNRTARAKAIAEGADELQRNYERESIDPPDNIGAINTSIVNQGEKFVKAIARSFETTGKAGAERTRELQELSRRTLKAATALQEAQQYLSPEAKQRIAMATELFVLSDPKAKDLATRIMEEEAAMLVDFPQPNNPFPRLTETDEETSSRLIKEGQKRVSKEDQAMLVDFPQPTNSAPQISDKQGERTLTADKALADIEKYLTPEAKLRIKYNTQLFGNEGLKQLQDKIADEDQVMNAAFPQPLNPQPQVSETEAETVNNIRAVVNLTGKVPSLSSMGENLPKRAAWKKAFGANFKPNGAAKPVFIRKALDISKATDTDVTAVIKAVMGKEQTAEQVFVTSGLSMIEARKLYEKNQEIRKLFEQMQGGNS